MSMVNVTRYHEIKDLENLIRTGLCVNEPDTYDNKALHFAVEHSAEKTKLLLDNKANVNAQDMYGNTPLFFAVQNGNIETTALLLEAGADINANNTIRLTSLHIAIEHDQPEIVNLLLRNGADYRITNQEGRTAMERIMCCFGTEDIRLILDGVDLSKGWATLYHAIERNNVNLVKLVIDHGAQVNAIDGDGRTGLHHAARRGNIQIVGLLLRHGADLMIQDDELLFPVNYATVPEIINLLMVIMTLNRARRP